MSKEPKQSEHDDLNQYIPRPEATGSKRHMIACEPDAYKFITDLATELDTTRNRVVTALVAYYKETED